MKQLFLFVSIFLSLSACHNRSWDKPEQVLVADTIITELSDGSVFSHSMTKLRCDSEGLYFADYMTHNLVVLDTLLYFKECLGQYGQGPEELIGLLDFHKKDSVFYILDDGNRALIAYSSGNKYVKKIKLPTSIPFSITQRFAFKNSLFYMSTGADNSIVAFNENGDVVTRFGGGEGNENVGGSDILLDNSVIWQVNAVAPIIKAYSPNGSLLTECDYSKIPFVDAMYDRDFPNTPTYFKSIVRDACMDGNRLYVLIADRILYFSLEEDIILNRIYRLPPDFHSSIATRNNVAYCIGNKGIARFKL
ncbi:MAG: 6-bladed beta-propeller [Mediterranea sp.]|jgi:hypothetical protein|nr:6-bladed beta-propeller [Mediterranea sp.]